MDNILTINGIELNMTEAEKAYTELVMDQGIPDDTPLTQEEVDAAFGTEDDETDLVSTKERALFLQHKLAYLMDDYGVKVAGFLPGDSQPSPNPNATRLREYWVHGEGAAKIDWGVPGDFLRCVTHLEKYVGERAKGLCNVFHRAALGVAPGQERPHKKSQPSSAAGQGGGSFNSALHPRSPAGSPTGGKFTAGNSGGSASGSATKKPTANSGKPVPNSQLTPADVSAIKKFQQQNGLPVTGLLDAGTVAAAHKVQSTNKPPVNTAAKKAAAAAKKAAAQKVTASKRAAALAKKTSNANVSAAKKTATAKKTAATQKLTASNRSAAMAQRASVAQQRAANTPPTMGNVSFGSGSSGQVVKNVQSVLGITADGTYGASTTAAVTKFQTANNLPPTGSIDGKTRAALVTQWQRQQAGKGGNNLVAPKATSTTASPASSAGTGRSTPVGSSRRVGVSTATPRAPRKRK